MNRNNIALSLLGCCIIASCYFISSVWCSDMTDKIILPFSMWTTPMIITGSVAILSGISYFWLTGKE